MNGAGKKERKKRTKICSYIIYLLLHIVLHYYNREYKCTMDFLLSYSIPYYIITYFTIFWVIIELIFAALLCYATETTLQKLTKPLEYDECPVAIINKMMSNLETLKTYDLRRFLKGWFCGSEIENVGLENMRQFLSWVMFASFFSDLDAEKIAKIDHVVLDLQLRLSMKFRPGFNKNVQHVCMTLQPIKYLHRPLVIYLLLGIKNVFADMSLQALGYQRRRHNGVNYYYRRCPASAVQEHTPSVFFHGISTGWDNYLLLVSHLSSDRAIFLFDLDGVKSHSLNFYMPTPEAYAETVRQVLDMHNTHRVNIVGHSFGTITAGWFVKAHPSYVAHMTLIDPVSLLLNHPEVAFNFLYRKPKKLMEWGIYLLVSTEITIANALRRNFWWYKNNLWLENLDPSIGVHVSLAGGDEVCNSEAVFEYVTWCGEQRAALKEEQMTSVMDPNTPNVADITVCFRDGHSHAEVMICDTSLRKMAGNILGGQRSVSYGGKALAM